MLFLYSLNGMLKFYGVYNDAWRLTNLIEKPTPVSSVKSASLKTEPQTQVTPNQNNYVLPKLQPVQKQEANKLEAQKKELFQENPDIKPFIIPSNAQKTSEPYKFQSQPAQAKPEEETKSSWGF